MLGKGSKKCATIKILAAEAANLRVFVGMVKGDAELKIFCSMLKYNNLFVAQNISGNITLSWGPVHWKEGRGYIQDTMGQVMGMA